WAGTGTASDAREGGRDRVADGAHGAGVERGAPGDRPAGASEPRHDFLDRHRLDAVADRAQQSVVELYLFGLFLPQLCGSFFQLAHYVLRRLVDRPPRGEGNPAAPRNVRLAHPNPVA